LPEPPTLFTYVLWVSCCHLHNHGAIMDAVTTYFTDACYHSPQHYYMGLLFPPTYTTWPSSFVTVLIGTCYLLPRITPLKLTYL